jgi:hypothetical protein
VKEGALGEEYARVVKLPWSQIQYIRIDTIAIVSKSLLTIAEQTVPPSIVVVRRMEGSELSLGYSPKKLR